VYNVLSAPTRYRIFVLVAAWIFLLFSCDASVDDSDASGPAPVPGLPAQEVFLDSSGNGSVTLTGLTHNDVYLVKVNVSDSQRTASVIPASSASGEEGIRVPAGTVTIDGQTFIRHERQWQIKGINTAGQALHQKQIRDLRPPAAASAASREVLNPSFPHSLDHARASTVAISLRSSIKISSDDMLLAKRSAISRSETPTEEGSTKSFYVDVTPSTKEAT
jgi:hypothetical protein